MMQCRLALQYSPTPRRTTDAWFIPGHDPSEWLAELLYWGLDLESITLYILPKSTRNATPIGVLAIWSTEDRPNTSRRCQPYGRVGKRLLLPVNSQLVPPVDDSEIEAILPGGNDLFVFHATAGLVRFDDNSAYRIPDLLQLPMDDSTDWNRAIGC